MSVPPLGSLEKVELRNVWQREDGDFTPWLAENLSRLGDAIGLDLALEGQEQWVGPFRADIVAKDTITGSWVLIENQLERTDHAHLGQLITYAAGVDAVTIVWIAARFTEEHRAALDWLNTITDRAINFFGIEVHLYQVDDSRPAVKFELISKPNDWTKTIREIRTSSGELTETQQLQLEYWTQFANYLEDKGSILKSQKPRPLNWSDFAIGRTNFTLSASMNTRETNLTVNLILKGDDAKPHFYLLKEEQEAIEEEIGFGLSWWPLEDKKFQ